MVVNGLQPGPNGEQPPPEVYSYGAKWPMLAVKLDPLYARRCGVDGTCGVRCSILPVYVCDDSVR